MATHTVSEARRNLAAIIDRVRAEHTPIYLARRGRRAAAVIDADDLDRILELAEDMADIRAAEAARAEMQATAEATGTDPVEGRMPSRRAARVVGTST